MASDALPREIGPFRIESELGRGMMGVVYKARDTRSKRQVALKIIRMAVVVSDDQKAGFERRFMEEAKIVARLDHPGIVGVYEIGRDPEQDAPYIAFEYLEGQTLAEMIEQGPLPWRTALVIVARVAEALEHAHRQGVIHRDIKPANVMILQPSRSTAPAKTRGKDSARRMDSDLGVKIMDFGLAKRDAGIELTSTGQFLGTPLYMSPEQALGRKVDARTDIFSLGSVAYTLLTGKRAFEGDSIPQVMNKVTYQHPPPPTRVVRELPAEIDYLVGRAMAKAPDSRYSTAFAFAEDINDVWHDRKPRHRAGWKAPSAGEGTLVSPAAPAPAEGTAPKPRRKRGAPPVDEISLLELSPIVSAPSFELPPRGGSKSAAWALLLMAVVGAGFFWRAEILAALGVVNRSLSVAPSGATLPPEPTRSGVAVASPPAMRITAVPAAATASPTEPTPEPTTEPTLEPTPEPTTAPTTVSAARATATPAVGGRRTAKKTPTPPVRPRPVVLPSKLSFVLEHHYKSGTVRVFVDEDRVIDESLTSRVTQDLKVLKIRKGRFQRVISVPAGTHRIRVELRSGGDGRVKESTAIFKSGKTRRLRANTNRVTGGLSLDWS
jgi:eukaryotic-like serine/threonine-protein kinase